MSPAGSEPAIPAKERPQTYALDDVFPGIGELGLYSHKLIRPKRFQ
jgi:hypothetical protein